jgi:hypothetical protein
MVVCRDIMKVSSGEKMIKLYNKSPYDDKTLIRVLSYCSRRMKVKGDTVVKVTCNHSGGSKGMAHRGFPYLWHLSKKRIKGDRRTKMIGKNEGWFEISIVHPNHIKRWLKHDKNYDISACESFIRVSSHEFAHIYQFRNFETFFTERTNTGKRIAHRKREIEIDANNKVYNKEP